MSKIIGIDLGSYNSSVSVFENGQVTVIPNAEGSNSTPSIVSFDKNTDEIKVGEAAKRQAALNPENTIFNVKRLIGRTYDEVKDLVRPYKIVNNDGKAGVQIKDKIYSPEEISAKILQKMKKTAEDYLGEPVKDAIITTPAYFNSAERESTKVAGEIAGLNVLRVVSEPTAAALNIKEEGDKTYMVVDSGGCTSDFSVINIADGVYEVLASDGDLELGGSIIDSAIVDYIIDEFKKENGVDLKNDPMTLQRVIDAAEKAKIELSSTTQTEINLPYITSIDNVPKHLVLTLNRSKFEQLMQFYVTKTMQLIKSSIDKSGKRIEEIDTVILVGGTTRIPYLVENIEKFFDKKANKSLNPDTAISSGAAIQGSILSGDNQNDILLLDVTPLNFYIETYGGVASAMILENTTIPTSKTQIFSTAADNQTSVDINIATGSRPKFSDNKFLGTFHLDGILPAKKGVPQIEVEFSIDANSILTVKATDKATNKENNIRIEGNTSLTPDEIERMKQEAEENAENDKKELERINKINAADSLIYQTENQIEEFSDKLEETEKTTLSEKVEKLKTAKESNNLSEIDNSIKDLSEYWNSISEKLYKQSAETSENVEQNN